MRAIRVKSLLAFERITYVLTTANKFTKEFYQILFIKSKVSQFQILELVLTNYVSGVYTSITDG